MVMNKSDKFNAALAEKTKSVLMDLHTKHDNVDHPDHYCFDGFEVIDVIQEVLTPEQFYGFLTGNIIKYMLRAGRKNGHEDHKKAEWYLDMLICEEDTIESIKEDEVIA